MDTKEICKRFHSELRQNGDDPWFQAMVLEAPGMFVFMTRLLKNLQIAEEHGDEVLAIPVGIMQEAIYNTIGMSIDRLDDGE